MATETTGMSAVAARYAGALYDLAESKGALDRVASDLASARAMIEASADLRRLCRSPVIGRASQAKAIAAVLDRAQVSELVRNFAGVAAANGRLFLLAEMAHAFLRLLAERRGETTVEVRTAQALDDGQMQALGQALRPLVGEKVAFAVEVDPTILGGLVVKVGSRMFDSSLGTKLARLQLAMKGVA